MMSTSEMKNIEQSSKALAIWEKVRKDGASRLTKSEIMDKAVAVYNKTADAPYKVDRRMFANLIDNNARLIGTLLEGEDPTSLSLGAIEDKAKRLYGPNWADHMVNQSGLDRQNFIGNAFTWIRANLGSGDSQGLAGKDTGYITTRYTPNYGVNESPDSEYQAISEKEHQAKKKREEARRANSTFDSRVDSVRDVHHVRAIRRPSITLPAYFTSLMRDIFGKRWRDYWRFKVDEYGAISIILNGIPRELIDNAHLAINPSASITSSLMIAAMKSLKTCFDQLDELVHINIPAQGDDPAYTVLVSPSTLGAAAASAGFKDRINISDDRATSGKSVQLSGSFTAQALAECVDRYITKFNAENSNKTPLYYYLGEYQWQ